MKLRVYSDLHNEFRPGYDWLPPVLEDDSDTVLVLAGDVHVGKELVSFINKMADRFMNVVYVLGNHEFYNGNIDRQYIFMSDKPNVHLLQNSTITIEDVQFVGTTLWTDMNYADPLTMLDAPKCMADFKAIRQGENFSRFTADRWIAENKTARKFLRDTVILGEKQVVITHHSPDFMCAIDNPHAGNGADAYYYNNNMTDIIADTSLWIYGHCHHGYDRTFGDMRIYSNPRGYDGQYTKELVPNFDELGVIEIW